MSYVQRAARIREHLKHVELGLARILFGLEQGCVGPPLAPLQFDLVVVVLLFRHGLRKAWGGVSDGEDAAKPVSFNIAVSDMFVRDQSNGLSIVENREPPSP